MPRAPVARESSNLQGCRSVWKQAQGQQVRRWMRCADWREVHQVLPRAKYLLVCILMLAGCTTGQYGYQTGAPTSRLPLSMGGGGAPSAGGGKIALLLPMTGPRADVGQVMSQAAQLALPPGYAPNLDLIDTGGSAPGAAAAAQTAVAHGDQMILGPLTSAETGAVAPVAKAAGIPVLAFTNDSA